MPKRTCSVDGCDRGHKSKGFCEAHYQRWCNTGDPQADLPIGTRRRDTGECKVDGCDRPRLSREWCGAHYQRWQATATRSAAASSGSRDARAAHALFPAVVTR